MVVGRVGHGLHPRYVGARGAADVVCHADTLRRRTITLLSSGRPSSRTTAVYTAIENGVFTRPDTEPSLICRARRSCCSAAGPRMTPALRAGALHYLIKPFSQAALHEQLRHVASLRSRLDDLDEARQEDVDQIFGTRPRGSRELPEGLAAHTADLVDSVLRAHPEGLSATECAEAGSLSRVSARRYLEYFTETGRAEVTLRYGGTGRPERRYRRLG
ncbi:two-component system response regulator [Streptomyces sp. NPDC014891]|uniref:two-component system response regulator n=1 Tax=Streptomyces sp. NPDC014891 TaxID=3364929 RepID=UPI0036F53659